MSEIRHTIAPIQSLIRAEVGRVPGGIPSTKGAEAFSAYAIASRKGLIPEIKMQPARPLNIP